jgi:hypothetical protein
MNTVDRKMNLEKVRSRIIENNFVIMRLKGSNKPLGVAMTEDGLQFICNKTGKALYYKNAFFSNGKLRGDLSKNHKIYIEKFTPNIGKNYRFINEEVNWMHKCNKLLSLDNTKYNISG